MLGKRIETMGLITEAHVQSQIPSWITDDTLEELKEVWTENIEGMEDDPEIAKIDFSAHVRDGTNWVFAHSETSDPDENIHMFELTPGPVFEGVFFIEVITNKANDEIRSYYIDNQ